MIWLIAVVPVVVIGAVWLASHAIADGLRTQARDYRCDHGLDEHANSLGVGGESFIHEGADI